MQKNESISDLLNLPELTYSCKLTEFVVPSLSLKDSDGEPVTVGGGFLAVNSYGEYSVSVGRIDLGILENENSSSVWVDVDPPSASSSPNSASTSSHSAQMNSSLEKWSSDEGALNYLQRSANTSSHKCASTDIKMGGCGVVLYFTHASHDTKKNREILMRALAAEVMSLELTRLLLLPGIGIDWLDLRNLRETCMSDSIESQYNSAHRGRSRSYSSLDTYGTYNNPIPEPILPKHISQSKSDQRVHQLDIGSKFSAYSAYGAISTLASAKGWVKKQKVGPNRRREEGLASIIDKPVIVLLGLTNAASELFRLMNKDGRYDLKIADPDSRSAAFISLASSLGVKSNQIIEWTDALYTDCRIMMQCLEQPISTITEDVIKRLKCDAFLTLSNNILPYQKDDRESIFIAFEQVGIFDLIDGVCDLGAYAKIYSLSQEQGDSITDVTNSFTVTDSYDMGVKVMEKANHLYEIVQQYNTEEKHQFYSLSLGDNIIGDHLGLGTIIGNSSDRMTEWMFNKTKALCPARRKLSQKKRSNATRSEVVHYLDLGAGNGSAARWICKQDPRIHVKCLNISTNQNSENRQLSDECGLGGQISVETGSFEEIPLEYSNTFDGCISQDSFLHSFDKLNAFAEALKVTKGGGWLMISDLMCGEALDVTSTELKTFAEKNNVMNWVTPTQCVAIAKEAGWSEVEYTDCTAEIRISFAGLLDEVKNQIKSNKYKGINQKLLQTQRLQLSTRLGQIDRGVFTWGIMSARKPYNVIFESIPPVVPDYHPMMRYSTLDVDGNLKFGTDVVVLTIKDQMPREKIMQLPSTTRLIVTMSAGRDHIDLEAAKERGIQVERAARDQLVKSVADYTVSSLIFGLRDGFGNISVPFPGAKDWTLAWNSSGVDLDMAKIGFIGIGRIVEETCRRIRALSTECELVYHVPHGIRSSFQDGTFQMYHVGIADLLSTCDAVILLCPLTSTTNKLLGYKEFSMMKKSAVFFNMARGKIVDTEGLYRAMKENIIGHVFLDTTEPEPLPKDHPLWNLKNVTITPHFATNTQYVRKELVEDIPNQIEDTLEGRGILRLEELRARKELSDAYRITREFGMDELVWNHLSLKLSDGTFLLTPGSHMFDDIRPQDLVKSDKCGNVTAIVIHEAVYQVRDDVKAIVHLHTPATVAVSCLEMGFVPLAQEAAPFVGRVARMSWGGISDDFEEQKIIADIVKDSKCNTLLMENHGFCTFGKTLGEAWVLAYYFDKACQTQLTCLSTGAKIKYPDERVLAHAAEQAQLPEFVPGACEWDALRKMLTRQRR